MAETKEKKKSFSKTKTSEPKVVVAGVETHHNSRSIVWAVFLLFVGIILLLNTIGVLDWTIWAYLWKFWPVFLILGGIRLIIGHSWVADVIVSVLAILVFSFIGLTSYIAYTADQLTFLPESVRNVIEDFKDRYILDEPGEYVTTNLEIKKDEYEEVEKRSVKILIGASKFELGDSDTDSYFVAESKHYENFGVPVLEQELSRDTLDISFAPNFKNTNMVFTAQSPRYNLGLGSPEIETDFDIDLGAGDGDLVFSELKIGTLDADVGAGKMTVDLGKESIPSEKLILDVGAGEIVLNIPESVGFVLNYDLGVGDIDYDGKKIAFFAGSDDDYKSSNYDDVETILNIEANVGVGSLSINSK